MPPLLIRADASARSGDGHVMRCLTLANDLRRRGGAAHFVAAVMPERLVRLVEASGHRVSFLSSDDGRNAVDEGADWDRAAWADRRQRKDAAATAAIASVCGATSVLVDHYRLDTVFEEAVGLSVVVLDDLANRPHHCSLLIDHNLGRASSDYFGLSPPDATILAGPQFAVLRPTFAERRPDALERRKAGGIPRRILVSLGSTDVGGFTAPALAAAQAAFGSALIDVVIRPDAPSRAAVDAIAAASSSVRVHDEVAEMATLMVESDLAIGAGGTTSWERCALGLPTACLVVAHNQRFVAEQLARAGAASRVENIADLGPLLDSLAADPARLERMSAAAFAITDGQGARRVVDRLLGVSPRLGEHPNLRCRRATKGDSEQLWLWRNDPSTRAVSQMTKAIRWQDHSRWLEATLGDPKRALYMFELGDEAVATVRFDLSDEGAEVSITLAPSARGQALAQPVLDTACREYLIQHPNARLLATIRPGNTASERIFGRAGFRQAGRLSSTGFAHYVAELNLDERDERWMP